MKIMTEKEKKLITETMLWDWLVQELQDYFKSSRFGIRYHQHFLISYSILFGEALDILFDFKLKFFPIEESKWDEMAQDFKEKLGEEFPESRYDLKRFIDHEILTDNELELRMYNEVLETDIFKTAEDLYEDWTFEVPEIIVPDVLENLFADFQNEKGCSLADYIERKYMSGYMSLKELEAQKTFWEEKFGVKITLEMYIQVKNSLFWNDAFVNSIWPQNNDGRAGDDYVWTSEFRDMVEYLLSDYFQLRMK